MPRLNCLHSQYHMSEMVVQRTGNLRQNALRPGPLSQHKDSPFQWKDSYYKDKMVVRPSYLYSGNNTVRRHLYIETFPK